MTKCKVIALANQKGGTAKTTTTLNLGIGLAHQGRKVLLVDADPQGDLTTALGWMNADSLPITLETQMKKILQDEPFVYNEGILHHEEGVDIIPTNIELSGMEISLVNAMSREQTLKLYLADLKKDYDYILIDCMPSLGMLTINSLAVADSVIVLAQAHYLPLKGILKMKNWEDAQFSRRKDIGCDRKNGLGKIKNKTMSQCAVIFLRHIVANRVKIGYTVSIELYINNLLRGWYKICLKHSC